MRKIYKRFLIVSLGFILFFSNTAWNVFAEKGSLKQEETVQKEIKAIGVGSSIVDTFPDAALAKVVADRMRVSTDTVITQDMIDKVKTLNAYQKNIKDISGIGVLTNLEELNLGSNRELGGAIPEEMKNLTKLTALDLSYCGFTSFPKSVYDAIRGNLTEFNFTNQGATRNDLPDVYPKLGTQTIATAFPVLAQSHLWTIENGFRFVLTYPDGSETDITSEIIISQNGDATIPSKYLKATGWYVIEALPNGVDESENDLFDSYYAVGFSSVNTPPLFLDFPSETTVIVGDELGVLDGGILEGISVWDSEDGPLAIQVEGTYDVNVIGEYTIVYSITDSYGNTNSKQRVIKVIEDPSPNTPPTLHVPAFTELTLAEAANFDYSTGVSVSDAEEALSFKDVTYNKVDHIKPGIYTIQYSVKDSDGAEASATQVLLINDGNYVVGADYIISANDFAVPLSQANMTSEKMKELAAVKVFDITLKNWIEDPVIDVDSSAYVAEVGAYNITFTYNPSITVSVSVYEDGLPSIDPEPPLASIDVPKTGVTDLTSMYFVLMMLSAVALGVYVRRTSVSTNKNK
ncbi:MAG: immunoglobulin-like domain-containing protein [Breznakia sp.]